MQDFRFYHQFPLFSWAESDYCDQNDLAQEPSGLSFYV